MMEPPALSREYSSADTVMDLDGTIALLKKHRLTLTDQGATGGSELLR